MKGINAFANKQWTLVLWPRLNSLSLANQIEFLDMFWWFDRRIKKNPVFPRIVNQLFEGWVTCRQEIPRESWGESKKEEWRGFLSLIRSERFARRVKAWTTEMLWNICVHSTRYTRVQSLNRLNWESNSPLAQNKLGTCQKWAGGRGVETEGGSQLFGTQKREGS